MLKFTDGSEKECEVTGRDMGDTQTLYKPLSELRPGPVNWETKKDLNHHVNILEVGQDYLSIAVTSWRGSTIGGPYKLHIGEKISQSYYFGEWEYSYALELLWQ